MGNRNTPLSNLGWDPLVERDGGVQPFLRECDPKVRHAEETEDSQDRIMRQRWTEPEVTRQRKIPRFDRIYIPFEARSNDGTLTMQCLPEVNLRVGDLEEGLLDVDHRWSPRRGSDGGDMALGLSDMLGGVRPPAAKGGGNGFRTYPGNFSALAREKMALNRQGLLADSISITCQSTASVPYNPPSGCPPQVTHAPLPATSNMPKRHEKYYFDDGSVVLLVSFYAPNNPFKQLTLAAQHSGGRNVVSCSPILLYKRVPDLRRYVLPASLRGQRILRGQGGSIRLLTNRDPGGSEARNGEFP